MQMLNRHKCVYTSAEALEWLCDVAAGMEYLHSTSEIKPMIIHRDLKLENVMLEGGHGAMAAKLVDFGLHKVGGVPYTACTRVYPSCHRLQGWHHVVQGVRILLLQHQRMNTLYL